MNTTFVTEAAQQHDLRAHSISLLGPLVAAAGLVWAFLQPSRITLLHPRGQGFERAMRMVSLPSSKASLITWTLKSLLASPGLKVRVAFVAT